MKPVWYPSAFSSFGSVTDDSRSRRSLATMPFLWAYWPVSRMARAGQQTGVLAKVWRNSSPSDASRSISGVFTSGLPMQPSAWARSWSQMMSSTLGRGGSSAHAVTGDAEPERPSSAR